MKILEGMPTRLAHITMVCLAPAITIAGETRLDWTFRKIELSSSGTVRVILPRSTERLEYVFGVRAQDNAEATFVVGEAISPPPGDAIRLRQISRLDNLPAHLVKVEGSTLEVLGASVPGSVLIIYGTVAPGTRVELLSPQDTVASAQLSGDGSLLVRDGAVIPERVLGVRTLVMTLIRPASPVKETSVKPLANGRYFAPVGALQRNLLTVTRPVMPVINDCAACREQVVRLQVHIDPTGNVVSVRTVGSVKPLPALEQAVRSWKFIPFEVNGTAVAVEGIVPFFIDKNGRVSSPLLSGELP